MLALSSGGDHSAYVLGMLKGVFVTNPEITEWKQVCGISAGALIGKEPEDETEVHLLKINHLMRVTKPLQILVPMGLKLAKPLCAGIPQKPALEHRGRVLGRKTGICTWELNQTKGIGRSDRTRTHVEALRCPWCLRRYISRSTDGGIAMFFREIKGTGTSDHVMLLPYRAQVSKACITEQVQTGRENIQYSERSIGST